MSTATTSARILSMTAAALAAGPALGALGSFTPADGYNINIPSGNVNWSDVTYYNAGNYGPNAGGGPGPTHITADTGKWRLLSQAGGFFPTSAARSAAIAGSPPYPTSVPPGTLPIYLVGDHFGGRADNSCLAFRNDTAAGSVGPATYDYDLDIYDTGGPVPSSVTTGNVQYNIYFATSPNSPPPSDGTHPADRFTQSLMDSSGNIGVQWGYSIDNHFTWRTSPSGPWNYTGIYANAGVYDGVRFDVDLSGDTFMLEYFNVMLNTWTTIVPAGTALGTPMSNFTGLRWQLEDGTNGGIGGKNFFDDAKFTIPAPGSAALLAAGALVIRRRRR
jgi:hypothetical protein